MSYLDPYYWFGYYDEELNEVIPCEKQVRLRHLLMNQVKDTEKMGGVMKVVMSKKERLENNKKKVSWAKMVGKSKNKHRSRFKVLEEEEEKLNFKYSF